MDNKVNEERENAAKDYCHNLRSLYVREDWVNQLIYDAFIAGTKWRTKARLNWTPTKEQLAELKKICNYLDFDAIVLQSLYIELVKL